MISIEGELDNKAIGARIRSIRRALGETTETFSKHFNPPASKGTISKWENGKYLPNNKRLKRIAELGGISVDELLYGANNLYYDIENYLDEYFDKKVIFRLKNEDISEKDITSFIESFKNKFLKEKWLNIKPLRGSEVDYQIDVEAYSNSLIRDLEDEIINFLLETENNIYPEARVVLAAKSALNELKSDIDFFDSFINHVETDNNKLEKEFIQSYRQFVNITEQLIEKYRSYD